jgi:dodecin
MAKKQTDSVYRIVDVVGVSEKSWDDAGRRAVETAAGSLRDLRVAEVTKMDMRVENGKVLAFRTRVAGSWSVAFVAHSGLASDGRVVIARPSGVSAIRSPSRYRRGQHTCTAGLRCPRRPAERSTPYRHHRGLVVRT